MVINISPWTPTLRIGKTVADNSMLLEILDNSSCSSFVVTPDTRFKRA